MVVRPPSLVTATVALAVLLAGCRSGGGADLGSGPNQTTTTTAPDTPAASTSQPPGSTRQTAPPATTIPGSPPATSAPTTAVPPPPASGLASVQIKLSRVTTFVDPVAMAMRTGDGAFYIAERRGRVRAFRGGAIDPTPVLDISGDVSVGTELGLLGLAFSPDGSKLYVNYTDAKDNNTTRIVEYGMNGLQADPATRRELLSVPQPSTNDKGGQLAFGPDGMLWIGLGDGGGGGDPLDNAQKLTSLLGKILRLDPRPSAGAPYTVPADNPFVSTPGARPEIWALGLRNPARFSFDRATGDLWIADIGQNAREEVDFLPAGARGGQNYGWARVEGTKPYSGAAPAGAVPPLFDIGRGTGACGITGGYVYRGIRIGTLLGAYLYADRCVGQINAVRQTGGQVVDQRAMPATAKPLTAFGQDGAGELYALTQDGAMFRIDPL